MTAHPLRALPLFFALLLLSCSGGIGSGRETASSSITGLGGARAAAIDYTMLAGTHAVALPSGEMILCERPSLLEYRMERLSPTLAPLWSRTFPVPESHRALAGASDWTFPADEGLLLDRAGAAVTLLCARRTGPDSIATVARLFDTATGRMIRDTILMRQKIDASIPEIARGIHAAVSPNGSRIVAYARLHAYGVEATELAVQVLDRYLNPIETRKVRCAVADDDQLGLLRVSNDGTIYILSKNRGDSIEILRLAPGGGAPARQTAAFHPEAPGLHLRSYAMTLGADGLPVVAATVTDGGRLTGIACGMVDFRSNAAAPLRPIPFGATTAEAPARARFLAFLPTPHGSVAVLTLAQSITTGSPGDTVIAIAMDALGSLRWKKAFACRSRGVSAPAVDAQVDDIGTLRLTSFRNDTLDLRLYSLNDGASLLGQEVRPLARFQHGETAHYEVEPTSLTWLDSHTATLAVDFWRNGELDRKLFCRIRF